MYHLSLVPSRKRGGVRGVEGGLGMGEWGRDSDGDVD